MAVGDADRRPISEDRSEPAPVFPRPKRTARADQSCAPYATSVSPSAATHVVKSLCHGASPIGTVSNRSDSVDENTRAFPPFEQSLSETRHKCRNFPRPAAHTQSPLGATAPQSTQSSALTFAAAGLGARGVPTPGRHAVTTEEFAEAHATTSPDADAAKKPHPLPPSPCSQRGARRDGRIANALGPRGFPKPGVSFEDTRVLTMSEDTKGGSNGFPPFKLPSFEVFLIPASPVPERSSARGAGRFS